MSEEHPRPAARTITQADRENPRPVYAVWEITLRCDHTCAHCGSRAGASRTDELTTEELLDVADQLIRIGTREVTLIGGEAYLRSDCYQLVRHLTDGGIRVTMQTGGRGFNHRRARKFVEAGLAAVGVSVDGPAAIHDTLRAAPGSFESAMNAIGAARDVGLIVTSNTQINRLNRHHLREVAELLFEREVRVWRAQLTVPMGNAADRPEWILQPWMIVQVIDTLAEIQLEAMERARAAGIPPHRAFHVRAGNNVGYYGPHEVLLRSRPGTRASFWAGCSAGQFVLGIESDGVIKGCPSLPTAPYVGGNIRDLSLDDIWNTTPQLSFTRDRSRDDLWGFCKSCYYAESCWAGCNFTSHSTMGRRGNQPFCYHRATQLARQGIRERLVRAVAPEGLPYDFGRFDLVEEPVPEGDELLRRTAVPSP